MKMRRTRQALRGLTLIELMVSITIGVVILLAITVVYQTNTNLLRQKEDMDEINEPLKLIIALLRSNITQAGYVDIFDAPGGAYLATSLIDPLKPDQDNIYVRDPADTVTTPLEKLVGGLKPVFGCDGVMNSDPSTLASATPPVTLNCGTNSTTRQTLQVAYQTVPSSSNSSPVSSLPPGSAITGEGRDCLQQTPTGTTGIVINRFSVQTSPADGANELYCEGSGNSAAQPLVRGVEELVFRYQLAQPGSAASGAAGSGKTQYLTATQVSALTNGWASVSSVEVCIIIATAKSKGSAAAGTVQLQPTRPTCARDASTGAFLANVARAASDTRLWKRTTLTFTVRNAIFSTPT